MDSFEPHTVDEHADLYRAATYQGGKIAVLVPTMYQIEPEMFESFFVAAQHFGREKLRFISRERTCIWVARNILAQRFLATDAEYALFIDADMCLPCGAPEFFRKRFRNALPDRWAAVNAITRIMSHPASIGIVGGAYFDRQIGSQLQCSRGVGSAEEIGFNDRFRRGEVTGLVECTWVATGFLRIARWVFEKIAQHEKLFPEMVPAKEGAPLGFFTPFRVGQGEDVAFAGRAGKVGIKSFLDAEIRLMHKGSRYF